MVVYFPEGGIGFFPIGWSKDNTALAFGWFVTTQMVTSGSRIDVVIQDLVTDAILWQESMSWEESNVGEGDDTPVPPVTASQAWEIFEPVVEEMLKIFGITEE